ncbi:MAG: NAD(P)H-dependent oxidoreductase [Gemmatimonadaceae bacterium]|jgi:NAD(P)H dehydrogenase (quinone)|nr:NAD(P)H-dependent oxidoreductase [Gemmatimonadaceae bacterium]
MHVLLIHAHPEPRSFTSALRDVARDTLRDAGHQVAESDLYAMRFDPVGGPHDVLHRVDPERFAYQAEQQHAAAGGGFDPVLAHEMEKLRIADLLVLTFPLWWFSVPATLKGWVDRVFAFGLVYGRGQAYAQAPWRGKRAICALTTGSPAAAFQPGGRNGDINHVLHHVQFGMLHFIGADVLPPFVAYSAARVDDATRAQYLDQWRERLRTLDQTPPLLATPAV